MQPEFTTEQLLARATLIDRQIETWKGNPGYAETLRMEAWALRAAARIHAPEIDKPAGSDSGAEA